MLITTRYQSDWSSHSTEASANDSPRTSSVRWHFPKQSRFPFAIHREELWDALQQSGLKDYVITQSDKLDARITANGDNLSVGQRQLVCLARAILQKPRIIVLDEATANIDSISDQLIQSAIKENFGHATVVSIAHRLNTVADFDMILVLDGGKLAEFDTPIALLSDETSVFAQMAKASGPGNFNQILKLAEKST